jgi:hypothetical protein
MEPAAVPLLHRTGVLTCHDTAAAGYIGVGVLAGLVVALTAITLLTRTEWGMERARRFAVRWLDDRIEGELRIGRITGPGLLGGVRIHDFGIIDPRGRPFLSTDSLELAYDWRTLLAGRIVLNRVVLHRPEIHHRTLPGDTVWNYEHVFPPGEPGPPVRAQPHPVQRRAHRRTAPRTSAPVRAGRARHARRHGPHLHRTGARRQRPPLRFEDVNGRLTASSGSRPSSPAACSTYRRCRRAASYGATRSSSGTPAAH